MIFDESTLRKLKHLTLVASHRRRGVIKGGRRSTRRGNSVEFADYRDYTPGDDLRRLDWNIYARSDRPFIKLFEEEEDLAVHVLLDASRSMDWGEGEAHKFRFALRLAAGLGAVALACGDALSIGCLQDGRASAVFGPARGQTALARLFAFLEGLQPGGRTDLKASLHQYFLTPRRPGLIILISDLLTPDGYEGGLRPQLARGHEAVLFHILAPDELDPPLGGDLQLVDVETGHEQDVSLDGGLRSLYRERVQDWILGMQVGCRKQGIRYLDLSTGIPWEKALLLDAPRLGILK